MPLDTGRVVDLHSGEAHLPADDAEPYEPTVHSGRDIGEALRAVREHRGLTLEEVAEATRVRRAYLAAIEDLRLELLPSRPFTIGYIRSYAEALGLDPEEAVYRFKADEPVLDEPLREPVGVHEDRDPRLSAMIAGGCVIVAAIFLWNIAQRAMRESAPPPPTASDLATAKAIAAMKPGPVVLGAPTPPPVESTTPAPYETPGMASADPDGTSHSGRPAAVGAIDPEAAPDPSTLAQTFVPEGKVYGAAQGQPSVVTLKALKSASVIVRGVDGSVYFARQLEKGEAYRVPQVGGLIVACPDPHALQVFVAGQSHGVLPSTESAAGALAG
jgi:cytoskeletal protein RodZ